MSSAFGKNIFGTSGSPSREELEQYLDGNLSPAEMHATEAQLANDPFAAEALEGFEAFPGAIGGMDGMQQQFDASLSQQAGTASKGFLAANKNWLIGSGLLIAGGIIGITLFNIYDTPETPEIAVVAPIIKDDHDARRIPFDYMEEMTDSAIDVAQPLPETEQVTYAMTLANQPETSDEPIEITLDPIVINPKPIDTMAVLPPEVVNTPVKKKIQSNVAITWVKDLKVVDYSEFYKGSISSTSIRNGSMDHLEATYETEEDKRLALANPDIIITYTPYSVFLEGAMEKFNKNDFKGALKDFNTILKTYPNDANAHFYGGLCYYNIDAFKKAIQHFELAEHNPANTFRQEALWYQVKAYLQKNKDYKARPILAKIIEEDGFYAAQAVALLEKLGPVTD